MKICFPCTRRRCNVYDIFCKHWVSVLYSTWMGYFNITIIFKTYSICVHNIILIRNHRGNWCLVAWHDKLVTWKCQLIPILDYFKVVNTVALVFELS